MADQPQRAGGTRRASVCFSSRARCTFDPSAASDAEPDETLLHHTNMLRLHAAFHLNARLAAK